MSLPPVYIVSSARTPVGSFLGYVLLCLAMSCFLNAKSETNLCHYQQSSVFPDCCPARFSRYQGSATFIPRSHKHLLIYKTGALNRAENITAADVEEVIFGNVLSAG
jgi:acetyl-CoA acetyltransferase